MLSAEIDFDFFKNKKNAIKYKPISFGQRIFLGIAFIFMATCIFTIANFFLTSANIVAKASAEYNALNTIILNKDISDFNKVEILIKKNTLASISQASNYVFNIEKELIYPIEERKKIYKYYSEQVAKLNKESIDELLSKSQENCSVWNFGCLSYKEDLDKINKNIIKTIEQQNEEIRKYEKYHLDLESNGKVRK